MGQTVERGVGVGGGEGISIGGPHSRTHWTLSAHTSPAANIVPPTRENEEEE